MTLKLYRPYTPSNRGKIGISFSGLSKVAPYKALVTPNHRAKGRNNKGHITAWHKGGGHKKRYRIIDFKRNKFAIYGKVLTIEYDPNRNAFISLICYSDGEKQYILHPNGLNIGDKIMSGKNLNLNVGNCMPLEDFPLGAEIHNIELVPGKGGQCMRAAGTFAKILAKEGNFVILLLASKEIRIFRKECLATLGVISNSEISNTRLGKAGQSRWRGIRPTVRGSAMNPVDHPHGGGEGKCSIGKPSPVTPWGKPALGFKTRKQHKSDAFILRRKTSKRVI